MAKILVYGATGWIGSKMLEILSNRECDWVSSSCRLHEYQAIQDELNRVQPTHVLLAAGLTGRPNVDWCESHQIEVLQVNVIGTSVLIDECNQRGIHVTYFGTGCIYQYDDEHPIDGKGFTELDEPNFSGSFYSKTKIYTEKILKEYDNVLILRIRMPLSDDLHPRNFITKITKYQKVVNVPNSMSVLHELLPIAGDMLLSNRTGIYNFTNPGVISHNQILELYRTYIDDQFSWTNFSLADQSKILKAGRSNNRLDTSKLSRLYDMDDILTAVEKLFQRMAESD